jgi:hypothetical protein
MKLDLGQAGEERANRFDYRHEFEDLTASNFSSQQTLRGGDAV